MQIQPHGHLALPKVASNFGKRFPKPRGAAGSESHGKAGAPRQRNPTRSQRFLALNLPQRITQAAGCLLNREAYVMI